jgi:autotransporter strand-loop-strand O-heptosyltransferase
MSKYNVDVIMLANNLYDTHYELSLETINSLRMTNGDVKFNIIIIESNNNSNYVFDDCLIVKPNKKFNYGEFTNIGYTYCTNDWVMVINNDLIFTPEWFNEIIKVYEENPNIKSFSSYEPNFLGAYYWGYYNDTDNLYFEYKVPMYLTGWCYLHKREILETIGGCDEQFSFYYVDNDYGKMLEYYNIPHCLVKSSIVYHKANQSHDTIPDLVNDVKFKEDEILFLKKWNNIGYNPYNINTHKKLNMKITQVTPGVITIPPNGWGAVEKVIWEYHNSIRELGHECDIRYLNEVDINSSDIVHIHMANLAIEAANRGIPYIFSLHDHHVVYYGKDSSNYQQNLEAIKRSIVSFTHAEFLVDYFDGTDKLFYLSHGVNTGFFKNDNPKRTEHKLLCLANNGILSDSTYDRKGFRYAIEAAIQLGLPITIAGPENNRIFFEHHNDLLNYDKLTLMFSNPNEEQILELYKSHSIFLHPSMLEAGHPNLTLLEAVSCNMPVVGTYLGSQTIEGMVVVERDVDQIVSGIRQVIDNYDLYLNNTEIDRQKYDWSVITKRMVRIYEELIRSRKNLNNLETKQRFDEVFENTEIKPKEMVEKIEIINHYINGALAEIKGNSDGRYLVEFWNRNGDCEYRDEIGCNMWVKLNKKYFDEYTLKIYSGGNLISEKKYDAKNKRVYIALDSRSLGDTLAWLPYADEFRKKHNCKVICSTFYNDLFVKGYPEIQFVSPGSIVHGAYAMYEIGWFYDESREPSLPNTVPLQKTATGILGLEFEEIRPSLSFDRSNRPHDKKYVVISTRSTAGCKEWEHDKWQDLVNFLKSNGYDVAVIQEDGTSLDGVIDWTGSDPLEKRMNQIYHADFFIGLGSGLSWLSWAVGTHVVMIANFSEDGHEFTGNTTRITNKSVCNSCWNNKNFKFDKGDWYWCPVNKGTDKQFECHKSISVDMVTNKIKEKGLIK